MRQLVKIISIVFLCCIILFVFPDNIRGYSNEESSSYPMKRFGHNMIYDLGNNRIILFGGLTIINSEYTYLSDTWIFDCITNTWGEKSHIVHPMGRFNFGMVYNSIKQEILLFGGSSYTGELDDTWIYDCNTDTWFQRHPEVSPPSRSDPVMYFDPLYEKTILFGGLEDIDLYNDTWIYDSSTNGWTEMHLQIAPTSRYGHRMVYNSNNQTGILFGGRAGEVTNDLWSYDYGTNSWKEINQSQGKKPKTRYWHNMVYDSKNHKTIVFGGRENESIFTSIFNDTWIYDPELNEWEEVGSETAPTGRCSSSSTYTSFNKNLVLFGGISRIPVTESTILNDTWVFSCENNRWKKIWNLNHSSSTISYTSNLDGSLSNSSTTVASSSGFTVLIILFLLPLSLIKLIRRTS
ncbi:MAG: Kelch repeat-containing protein [Candidatus Thorarchaeota archaeon]